jgi:hypothetical protein
MDIYGLGVGISILFEIFSHTPKAPGVRKPEIHNLCPSCPKDASYQI